MPSKIFKNKLFLIASAIFFLMITLIILKLKSRVFNLTKETYLNIVSDGFESGHINDWEKQLPGFHSCRIVTHPVRAGRFSARFEMRQGDKWDSVSRAELYEKYSPPFNQDVWYSFSTYIPKEWKNKKIRCLIAQWHGVRDKKYNEINCSPPLGIEYNGKDFLIRICWNDKLVNMDNLFSTTHLTELYSSNKYAQKGIWHDFVVNVKWSSTRGYLNIWIDKNQVVDYDGPIGYNDEVAPYFKFGIYRDDIPETYVLYHDEFKRGNTRNEIGFLD